MSDIVTKASVILTIYHLALCVSARSAQELIAEVFIWNSFWHGVMGNPRCFQDSIVFFLSTQRAFKLQIGNANQQT